MQLFAAMSHVDYQHASRMLLLRKVAAVAEHPPNVLYKYQRMKFLLCAASG